MIARAADSATANVRTLVSGKPYDTALVQGITEGLKAINPGVYDNDNGEARRIAKQWDLVFSVADLILGFKAAGGKVTTISQPGTTQPSFKIEFDTIPGVSQ